MRGVGKRRQGLVFGALLATAALLPPGQPVSAQGGCRLARGDTLVGRACAEGGLMMAKKTMRELLKQGRAAGVRHECDDCHTDDNAFDKLAPDARDKLARLLAVLDKKR